MPIKITLDGTEKFLSKGEFVSSVPELIYRDAPQSLLGALVEKVRAGENWENLVESDVRPRNAWLADIISSPKRNAFLNLIDEFKEGSIGLDIGAGWGQHTVEIAKVCSVLSLEPSPERFQFMREICSQESLEDRCYFVNASLNQIEFGSDFDFAVSIGVLEWVGKFEECKSPREAQLDFLRKIRSGLKDGAPLVIGIENRMGLKYLMGSNDDHIGKPHILCREFEDAQDAWYEGTGEVLKVCTYSMSEYRALLNEAGFLDLVFHAALPDYKMPERIIECLPVDRFSDYLVSGEFIEERDGSNGKDHGINPQLKSVYKTLGREGIAPLFAPSYFIVAR